MDIDEMQDLLKEFEGKWCRIFFVDGVGTLLKILKVSGDNLLCQNVHGTKKLISTYDIKNLDEFSGIIRATGEAVQNGLVVSTQQVVQNASTK
jgi:hypothetical protein